MIEIWGGIEGTVNRVGNRYIDQVIESGHHHRSSDLDRIAPLGLAAVRYPVLWERTCGAPSDWEWPERRLDRLRAIGIRPIVGLLHHGSGPCHTDLTAPDFADKFAAFAGQAAARFSWVGEWTPINEPVTTARFSGLYGHWFPHARSEHAFLRMLVNQCRALVLAAQAIRSENPNARIIHTDDAGTIHATEPLQYQADFENLRRDLALDLLFGRVDGKHPLSEHLLRHGISERELEWFLVQRAAPDVLGANYYVTSDRMLDHRQATYDPDSHASNGRHHYADVAAVVGLEGWEPAFADLLERWWRRYQRPVALTEVHIGCTRDEQLRWLTEAWTGAIRAEAIGVDVRAVTTWALLGSFGWDRLVTSAGGAYEPGAFDVRGGTPRRTALFGAVRTLSAGKPYSHPVLDAPGWWRSREAARSTRHRPPIVIFGAGGTLGQTLVRHCRARALEVIAMRHDDVDVCDAEAVHDLITASRPWAVINAAGFVRVDDAEQSPTRCLLDNVIGPRLLARESARAKCRFVTFSSDLVFDGKRQTPYVESDVTNPLSTYGRSKRDAEVCVLETLPSALIVRTSAFFTAWDEANFVTRAIASSRIGEPIPASRAVVSPTWVPSLADAVLDLLIDDESGIWHLANAGEVSWAQFARLVIERAGGNPDLVEEVDDTMMGWLAPRPAYSALGSERGTVLPLLETALDNYFAHRTEALT